MGSPSSPSRRPLPTPPSRADIVPQDKLAGMFGYSNPNFSQYAYPPFAPSARLPNVYDEPPTTLPGGTLLHQGFYDLLSMIPTPSPSRLFWGAGWNQQPVVAGPRYEDLPAVAPAPTDKIISPTTPPASPTSPLKKGRKISKDMVSSPTGFVCVSKIISSVSLGFDIAFSHLVHASDADQAEALLTRWGPDGLGKLGG